MIINDFAVPSRVERSAVYTAAAPGWVSLLYEVVDPANGGAVQASLEWSTPNQPARRPIRAQESELAINSGSALDHPVLRYQSDGISNGSDDDFHLSSTAGSWHGGIFAADGSDSPAIDSGDLTSDFGGESSPNGGRVNLGFEGNTAQASRSPVPALQLLSPNGFEKYRINGGIVIQWRTIGEVAAVDVAVSYDGGKNFETIVSGLQNDGNFAWNPRGASNRILVRISSSLNSNIRDTSDSFFTVGVQGNSYYVNDESTVGDVYSNATGDNANSGTTPDDPMSSVNAVLSAYNLEPGDTIYVDSGYYQLPPM